MINSWINWMRIKNKQTNKQVFQFQILPRPNKIFLCGPRWDAVLQSSGAQTFGSWATFVFQNPSRATRINNLNKNSLKYYLKWLKCHVFFAMKIASRATPEGLAGHGLSTTAVEEPDTKL